MLAEARALGLDEAALAQLRARLATQPDAEDGVWHEHAVAVGLFASVSTQWRTCTFGGGMAGARVLWIGLDYAALKMIADMEDVALVPELFEQLRIMEAAAAALLNGSN